MIFLGLVYLFFGLAIYVFWSYARSALRSDLRKLPGPRAAHWTGFWRASVAFGGDGPAIYRAMHRKLGPIIRSGPNHVSISDPAMISVIYGVNSKFTKSMFYSTADSFHDGKYSETMFSARSFTVHKRFRQQVAQLYTLTNLRTYEPYEDECTAIFCRSMVELQGQPIDLSEWLQWYAFDVIACITFQRRFGFMEERKDIKGMISGVGAMFPYMASVGQFPALHPWILGNRTLTRLRKWLAPDSPDPMKEFLQITAEEIKRYDSTLDEKRSNRTDMLAQLREKEAKTGKIPPQDVVQHLSSNLIAGSDTTGISLRSCLYYLMRNPSTYRKLMAEIDQADKNGQLSEYVTFEESLKMPYLQAVIKEALRLHPAVALPLERTVPEGGMKLCGYFIDAGTSVGIAAPVISHNEEIYGPDTDKFRPERWLDASEEELKAMDRYSLTFGHGSRTCIGKNISTMEIAKFLPHVLRHFEFEWAAEKPDWEAKAQWFWRQTGMIARVYSRRRGMKS